MSAVVVVGTSWGGLEALGRLFAPLPPWFPTPLVVVQHRGSSSPAGAMRRYLADRCALCVVDVEDKQPMEPGHVYLGPPDYHLLVEEGWLGLSVDLPVGHSRPSIDVLFESAAASYGPATVAVVLTGANTDGSRGALAVRAAGGVVLAQDPEEAERPEMPAAAATCGAEKLPLDGIAHRLLEICPPRSEAG